MDWPAYYPNFKKPEAEESSATEEVKSVGTLTKNVEIADIGCGFGGLLVALAPKLPDSLILGILLPSTTISLSNNRQEWKSALKSPNSFRNESRL